MYAYNKTILSDSVAATLDCSSEDWIKWLGISSRFHKLRLIHLGSSASVQYRVLSESIEIGNFLKFPPFTLILCHVFENKHLIRERGMFIHHNSHDNTA